MPSEERVTLALEALAEPIAAFHATLLTTADAVRRHLGAVQSTWDGRVARLGAELGPLAAGRIDIERFATVFGDHQESDPAALAMLGRALDTLTDLADRLQSLCAAEVPPGGSLQETVARALGEIGRAFGAARVAQAARLGKAGGHGAEQLLQAFPFSRWTKAERRLAPPLAVRVRGADVRAAGLAEFLDGRQRLVLAVEGECPPAPLARLVAPGTLVLQTADGTGLDRLAAWDGPGIAAIVPESAVRFLHDPAAGRATWERITISHMPDEEPRRTLGGLSPSQQLADLDLLRTLAARPAGAAARPGEPVGSAVAAGAGEGADPADRLAAWLLSQADLSDLR